MANQSHKDQQLNSPNLLLISLLEKVKILNTSQDIPNLPQIVRLIFHDQSTSMASNSSLDLLTNSTITSYNLQISPPRLRQSGPVPFSFLSKIPS